MLLQASEARMSLSRYGKTAIPCLTVRPSHPRTADADPLAGRVAVTHRNPRLLLLLYAATPLSSSWSRKTLPIRCSRWSPCRRRRNPRINLQRGNLKKKNSSPNPLSSKSLRKSPPPSRKTRPRNHRTNQPDQPSQYRPTSCIPLSRT